MPKPASQRGVTLTEACVVMAITAILAGAAAPAMSTMLDGRRLDGAATQLASDIQFVRSMAVARNEPVRFSLHATADGSCYVIHTGLANECRCSAAGPAQCSGAAVQIKTTRLGPADRVSLQATAGSLVFDPLHGTVSPAATLKVIAADGRAVHHVVNILGRLRSCSPQARMAGYPTC